MLKKVKNVVNLVQNMGWRYVKFRAGHELKRRSGIMKKNFPVLPEMRPFISLEQWKISAGTFFFTSKESLQVIKNPDSSLEQRFNDYCEGKILFFNSTLIHVGKDYDWITNPDTGYRYDHRKHWTEIADYSQEAGDIKYVWEKSRFSFLYDIIRYDYHFGKDCSDIVFKEILSWIDHNPVNCGPNYRCSQEMSLRVLNWTFALYYYKNSSRLTGEVFDKIQHAIYWQMHHIYHNIHFSRITVRNNHALTETLTLHLISILYPSVKDFRVWGKKGKKWFEEEIAYQIYEDGTFLQFSMNYHRVAIQLMTWGIRLSELNNDPLDAVVYDRAEKSLLFLRVCMDEKNGWLPNYGANDGALFFRLNNDHYRDYRSQLTALASVLGINAAIDHDAEDEFWYSSSHAPHRSLDLSPALYSFDKGGYYIIKEEDALTFIRCGSYKDRPSQADNLHLDIWYKGENILLDAGSYKYNTDEQVLKYFIGTASHNTVMLNGYDQMQKGSRFIWYHWTQCADTSLSESSDEIIFKGTITAFSQLNPGIQHTRIVTKIKGIPEWHVHDAITNLPEGMQVKQLWHLPLSKGNTLFITAKDSESKTLSVQQDEGWHSPLYGFKEKTRQLEIVTNSADIYTMISAEIIH